MKRYQLIVTGRVQNVGFRIFAQANAITLGLTGSVRNLEDGNVEVFVQGKEDVLNEFFKTIYAGNHFIRVDSIQYREYPIIETEKNFTYNW